MSLSNQARWSGYSRRRRKRESVFKEAPPSVPLTEKGKQFLKEKLQLHDFSPLHWPAVPRSTEKGVLFPFPGSTYWQERRIGGQGPKWVSAGPSPPLYLTRTEGEVLFVVEGVFDALAVHREGQVAAAVLTTLPRFKQLRQVRDRFKTATWIPDGDVPVASRVTGLDRLRLIWPDAQGIALPDGEDPASLLPLHLRRRLGAATTK